MRKTFIAVLNELAEKDDRIMLLTSDLGYLLMEPFAQKFPNRFVNVGVSEQNMVGLATGLAESGMIPYIYSITPFAVLRPYEFIRNGPIYHQLKVRIIGSGGGFDYPHDGISHFGIDDIGVLRVQPGLSIFVPADYQQAASVFRQTWDLAGPVYYRLAKDETTVIPGLMGKFEVGSAQLIGQGRALLMVSMGSIASEAAAAMDMLAAQGISCTLMVASSINPLPESVLREILPQFQHVMTVEAHYVNGGIGSLISEFVAEGGYDCVVTRCGIRSMPDGMNGSLPYLYDRFGISSQALVQKVMALLQKGVSR